MRHLGFFEGGLTRVFARDESLAWALSGLTITGLTMSVVFAMPRKIALFCIWLLRLSILLYAFMAECIINFGNFTFPAKLLTFM